MISTADVNTLDIIDKNSRVIEAQPGNCCHHYWLIDRANGPESHAVCKYCHEERSFSNLPLQYQEQKIEGNPEKQALRSRSFRAYELFGGKQRQALPGRKEVANRSN
jgi:hypothetical protein